MEQPSTTGWSAQVYEEACDWFVEFRTGVPDAARREAFHTWLQQSPAHMGAYLEAAALWNRTAVALDKSKYSIDALVAAAALDPDNVRVLPGSPGIRQDRRQPVSPRRRWMLPSLAACLIVAVLGAVSWWAGDRDTYAAGTGEQRSIPLNDGSIIDLNSRSAVRVHFTESTRTVRLLEGQALFKVAHEARRPFIVEAGGARIQAVGTEFDVNRVGSGTIVTVIEGKVAVGLVNAQAGQAASAAAANSRASATAAAVTTEADTYTAAAGEQVRVARDGGIQRKHLSNTGAVTAWTARTLVFESTSLAEVVEEFNRYNKKPLVIRSPALRDFQIDGVFSSTDPQPLIRFLQGRPGIRVTEADGAIVITSDDPAS